jgi:uncharacterized membrane protein
MRRRQRQGFSIMASGSILMRCADRAASLCEVFGVLAVVAGALLATVLTLAVPTTTVRDTLRHFRHRFGRSIVLGLELLVAADILRTLMTTPTLGPG